MSAVTIIEVGDCTVCPFFEQHATALVLAAITKQRNGTCKANALNLPFPQGRLLVTDPLHPPGNCPLRTTPFRILLKEVIDAG